MLSAGSGAGLVCIKQGQALTLQLAPHCFISRPAETSPRQLSSRITLCLAGQNSLNRALSNFLVCASSVQGMDGNTHMENVCTYFPQIGICWILKGWEISRITEQDSLR